ncbi:protein kinase superfamily protein [Actinidia rufa]|uniref:Protein kinase superfamily protein n=1 Tax=Actinidia rufa TaxID=165716 RepID=A0A7J0GT74_9ERIC|nr:protein kinase superfamily protein [Actinidia rufa]
MSRARDSMDLDPQCPHSANCGLGREQNPKRSINGEGKSNHRRSRSSADTDGFDRPTRRREARSPMQDLQDQMDHRRGKASEEVLRAQIPHIGFGGRYERIDAEDQATNSVGGEDMAKFYVGSSSPNRDGKEGQRKEKHRQVVLLLTITNGWRSGEEEPEIPVLVSSREGAPMHGLQTTLGGSQREIQDRTGAAVTGNAGLLGYSEKGIWFGLFCPRRVVERALSGCRTELCHRNGSSARSIWCNRIKRGRMKPNTGGVCSVWVAVELERTGQSPVDRIPPSVRLMSFSRRELNLMAKRTTWLQTRGETTEPNYANKYCRAVRLWTERKPVRTKLGLGTVYGSVEGAHFGWKAVVRQWAWRDRTHPAQDGIELGAQCMELCSAKQGAGFFSARPCTICGSAFGQKLNRKLNGIAISRTNGRTCSIKTCHWAEWVKSMKIGPGVLGPSQMSVCGAKKGGVEGGRLGSRWEEACSARSPLQLGKIHFLVGIRRNAEIMLIELYLFDVCMMLYCSKRWSHECVALVGEESVIVKVLVVKARISFLKNRIIISLMLSSQTYDPNAPTAQNRAGPSTPRHKDDRRNMAEGQNSPDDSRCGGFHGSPSNHRNSPDFKKRDAMRELSELGRIETGGGSGRKWGVDDVERLDSQRDSPVSAGRMKETPRNRDLDRERAVAEAKVWGENWRERKRANAMGSFDGTNE